MLSVKAFRPTSPGDAAILRERGLDDVPASFPSWRDLAVLVRRPRLTVALVALLVRTCRRRSNIMLRSLLLLPRAVAIADEIAREKPDVVHAFWGHYPAMALIACRLVCGAQRPVITTSLIAYDLEMRYPPGLFVARRIADHVFTHAGVNVPVLIRQGVPSSRLSVIRAGVEPGWISDRDDPATGPLRLVAVGRVITAKGHFDAVASFSTFLAKTGADASLGILGDGPEMPLLRSIVAASGVAERITLTGHVPHGEVRTQLMRAQVFLLLSWYAGERLPNAVKEAMACGCVCIVADSPGMSELVVDGVTGWIVPPRDPAAAADRLGRLWNDQTLFRWMSAAARQCIAEHFNADCQQAAYAAVWRECALLRREF